MRRLQMHEATKCVRAATWQDLQKLSDLLPGWVFRGQSEIKWRLQPTLERFAQRITSDHTLSDIEGHVVTQFKRGAPTYLDDLPMHEDIIGWLSLIQSYGGPTRLLDMTRSLYVAAFFALAEPSESQHRVVWAINDRVIRGVLPEELGENPTDALRHLQAAQLALQLLLVSKLSYSGRLCDRRSDRGANRGSKPVRAVGIGACIGVPRCAPWSRVSSRRSGVRIRNPYAERKRREA